MKIEEFKQLINVEEAYQYLSDYCEEKNNLLSKLQIIEEVSVHSIFVTFISFFVFWVIWTINFNLIHHYHIHTLYYQALFSTGFISLLLLIFAGGIILVDIIGSNTIKKIFFSIFLELQKYFPACFIFYCHKTIISLTVFIDVIRTHIIQFTHKINRILFEPIKLLVRPYYKSPISIQHFVHYIEFNEFKDTYKHLFEYSQDQELQHEIIFSCKKIILDNFLNEDSKLLLDQYYKFISDLYHCDFDDSCTEYFKEGYTSNLFCHIIFILHYLSKIESENKHVSGKPKLELDKFKENWLENKAFVLFDTFQIKSMNQFSPMINKINSYTSFISAVACFMFLFISFSICAFSALFVFQYFHLSYSLPICFSLLTFGFLFSFIITFVDEDKWWWIGQIFLRLFYKKQPLNKLLVEQYQPYIDLLHDPLVQKQILFYLQNLIFIYHLERRFHTQHNFLLHISHISFYFKKQSYLLALVEIFEFSKFFHHLAITSTPFIRYEDNVYIYTKSAMLHNKIFNDLDKSKAKIENTPKKRQKI